MSHKYNRSTEDFNLFRTGDCITLSFPSGNFRPSVWHRQSTIYNEEDVNYINIGTGEGNTFYLDYRNFQTVSVASIAAFSEYVMALLLDVATKYINGSYTAGSGNMDVMWFNKGSYNFLTSATVLSVKSYDAQDDIAGDGARKVMLYGLDSSWNEISEEVELVGSGTSSNTTATFIRINQAKVTEVGISRDSNHNKLEIKAGATVIGVIGGFGTTGNGDYGSGALTQAVYSVPAGMTMYITGMTVGMDNKNWWGQLYKVENADISTSPRELIWRTDESKLMGTIIQNENIKIPEKSDVWFALAIASPEPAACRIVYQLNDSIL